MKSRRAIVTLEISTDESIKALKEFDKWKAALEYVRGPSASMVLHQVQANAIKRASTVTAKSLRRLKRKRRK